MVTAKLVRLPWTSTDLDEQRQRGKEISDWLKAQGMRLGADYTWLVSNKDQEIHILLTTENEYWASAITMKYL
jgi:hypothetical protein